MVKPTIHLNGTSCKELERQYSAAIDALRDAISAVVEASPNGRDYYPQGNDAINMAMQEHNARITALRDVRAELNDILLAIIDGE